MPKKLQGSRNLGHAHFQEKLFVRPLCIPGSKLHAKFEVSSSSRFRNIALYACWGHEFDLSRSQNRSGDHSIAHMPFPIGSPLEPNLYL